MAVIRVVTPTELKVLEHGDNLLDCTVISIVEEDTPEELAEKQSL